jgi:hypothetical protein
MLKKPYLPLGIAVLCLLAAYALDRERPLRTSRLPGHSPEATLAP